MLVNFRALVCGNKSNTENYNKSNPAPGGVNFRSSYFCLLGGAEFDLRHGGYPGARDLGNPRSAKTNSVRKRDFARPDS